MPALQSQLQCLHLSEKLAFTETFRQYPKYVTYPRVRCSSYPQRDGGSGTVGFAGNGRSGVICFSPVDSAATYSWWSSNQLRERLSAAGLAGLVAYGLANTAYYTVAFLFVWLNVLKLDRGRGLAGAAIACVQTLALVWVGSQVTKVPRAAAALLAVPLVDGLLGSLRDRMKLETKLDAFLRVILPTCIAFALLLFGSVTLIWA